MTALWTISDVQQFARIKSRSSVYGAIRDGLPVIKIGGMTRFNPDSVVEFFTAKERILS